MATQSITATFNGAQPLDGDFPYVDITWLSAYASVGVYRIFAGTAITDASGVIVVNLKTKSPTGVRVTVSDQFVGSVELLAVDA